MRLVGERRLPGTIVLVVIGSVALAGAAVGQQPSGLPSTAPGPAADSLSAAGVLGIASPVDAPFRAVEDQGVVVRDDCLTSMARALTADGLLLELTLFTALAPAAAASRYEGMKSWVGASPEAVAFEGGEGVSANGTSVLLHGSQVGYLRGDAGPAQMKRLEKQKLQGKDTSRAYARILGRAASFAPAIGAGMTGTCPTEPMAILPAGAVDPCPADLSALASGAFTPTTAERVFSSSPPWLECLVQSEQAGPISFSTVTDRQLASSIVPTTPDKVFASLLKAARDQPGFDQFQDSDARLFGTTDPNRGLDIVVLMELGPTEPASKVGDGHATVIGLAQREPLLQDAITAVIWRVVNNASSDTIDEYACATLLESYFSQMGGIEGRVKQQLERAIDWCIASVSAHSP